METNINSQAAEIMKLIINYRECGLPVAGGHNGLRTSWRIFHNKDLSDEQKKKLRAEINSAKTKP